MEMPKPEDIMDKVNSAFFFHIKNILLRYYLQGQLSTP